MEKNLDSKKVQECSRKISKELFSKEDITKEIHKLYSECDCVPSKKLNDFIRRIMDTNKYMTNKKKKIIDSVLKSIYSIKNIREDLIYDIKIMLDSWHSVSVSYDDVYVKIMEFCQKYKINIEEAIKISEHKYFKDKENIIEKLKQFSENIVEEKEDENLSDIDMLKKEFELKIEELRNKFNSEINDGILNPLKKKLEMMENKINLLENEIKNLKKTDIEFNFDLNEKSSI